MLKPAEQTPLTSLLLARVLEDSGVPAGVVNMITTSNSADVIAQMMHDPRARKISLTGSAEVGKAHLRQAAENVMNTSMELGGNAPVIIFEDVDLGEAVAGAMVAKLRNGGESCIAANRIYVQRPVAVDFVRRFSDKMQATRSGDGSDPASELGPLIDDRQLAKVASLVSDAVRKGSPRGRRVPSRRPRLYLSADRPAQCAGERPDPDRRDSRTGRRDLRIRFRRRSRQGSEQHTPRPGFIRVTRDLRRALRVADALDAGMTGISRGAISNPAARFGGTKASGSGREGGSEGLEAYLETKYTGIQI